MELIYHFLETIFPFSFMQYDFMKNAFLSVLIITPLFGMLGTMIVNNKLAFFSDALGHSAFTGISLGIIFGLVNTNLSMVIFAALFALLLNAIRHRNLVAGDTVISVFSSLSTAIGLVFLSRGGEFSKYSALLVGDILSIKPQEIGFLFIVFFGAILLWCLCFNPLHAISLNASLAKSKQIRVALYDNIFVILIALIVMLSIQWVGILIINALLILPAAAARNLAGNMKEYHAFSILISLFSGVMGLVLSYLLSLATGPMIVIIAAAVFFITMLYRAFERLR